MTINHPDFRSQLVTPIICSDAEAKAILASAGDDVANFVRQTKPVIWFHVGDFAVAGLRPDRGVVTLCSTWVHADYRNRGIGRSLIAARLEYARGLGYHWARTWAFHPEEFERMGWQRGRKTSVGAWYMRGKI
jgi:GNAT superfamily N-acetyltransferase